MNNYWLKSQFECQPGKTKSGLAKALGLEPPAISKILNGTRQIKAREYAIMREYFGLPANSDNMMKNNYRLQNFRTAVDLIEKSCNGRADDWFVPISVLQNKGKTPDKIRIFTVEDDLMLPEFRRGDSVFVDLTDCCASTAGVFVVSDGFGAMIRECSKLPGTAAAQIEVRANNPAFPPTTLAQDDFKILGRVIAKLQWL